MQTTRTIAPSHALPQDLAKALAGNGKAHAAWKSLTPLARNEWICWTISTKKPETRTAHVHRAIEELAGGKRRPCCWGGCTHRKDKALSASQKFMLKKRRAKA